MIFKSLRSVLFFSVFLCALAADAQTAEKAQATPPSELTVNESFDPPIAAPAFRAGKGPTVVVDEKHRNVVSLKTYFGPVGRFLGKDGYNVRPGTGAFATEGLAKARVLVIANAQAADGPSAAGKPIVLAFSHGKGRVVVIGDAGIASAFGSRGGATHRGISEADNALFVRNVVRWLAK